MTDDRAAFEGIQSATILKPGDRVLVVVEGKSEPGAIEHMRDMRTALHDRFPGTEFTFVFGVDDVVVKSAEGSADA